jgi:hypothetical protein
MNTERNLLTLDDKEAIAYALFDSGCVPMTSTNYADEIIRGFGDGDGYFEHQLVCDEKGEIVPWPIVKEAALRMRLKNEAFDIEKGLPLYIIRGGQVFKFQDGYFTVSFLDEDTFMLFDRETRNALFVGTSAYNTVEAWNAALEYGDVIVRKPGVSEE